MRDVIIIGAGGGGPIVAKELAAQGLDVLMLEAGARNKTPEKDWRHFENDANNPLSGYLRFGPSDRSKPSWYRELTQPAMISNLSGVGGTTQHYFGNSPRAMPGVFKGYQGSDAQDYDRDYEFPFSYEELRPYYEWVEATLPVQTAAMGTSEQVFFNGCENIGMSVQVTKDTLHDGYRPQQNAVLQPGGNAGLTTNTNDLKYPLAKGCTFCGHCTQGCYQPLNAPRNLKARRSTDNSYVPMALTADLWAPQGKAITLIADAYVTQIHTQQVNGKATATGVSWRDVNSGDVITENAKVVVMAGGCIENPRLWLNSGLPNSHDWVGRGLTDHAFDFVCGVFPFDTDSSKGVGSSARADFPGKGCIEPSILGPSGLASNLMMSDSGIRGMYDNGRGVFGEWDGPSGRLIGNEFKNFMKDVNKTLGMLIITDDDVEANNRVEPSSLMSDENGAVPKMTIHKRTRSQRTLDNREFLANKAASILRAAGATEVLRIDIVPLLLHLQSSMRMGENPQNSVINENGEAHEVAGLFVADNSALSNALGGPNPTLTTQALATRTAEKIMVQYFSGTPWVNSSEPLSSIDDQVTEAVLARGI
jgi:choline dehydrogenase-like flavoprotein